MLHALCLAFLALPQRTAAPARLERVAVVKSDAPGGEIVAVQAKRARAVLTHSKGKKKDRLGEIELLDLSDPALPRSVRFFDLGLEKGEEVTSVSVPPDGDWFLAVAKARRSLEPGRALLVSLADGSRIAAFPTGVGPDCVSISKSGALALIACEAEGFELADGHVVSRPGSLTLIRFAQDLAASTVVQIPFESPAPAPTDGRRLERNVDEGPREIELEAGPDFIEPEVVAILPGDERALVTLQENNCVAYVDLAAGKVERLVALGNTRHPADLDDDGEYAASAELLGRREPDGIALTPDRLSFVTADEGDTEPGVAATPEDAPRAGGRTLTVFDLATGEARGDTGGQLDAAAARAGLHDDKRSLKKGCEPEMVLTFERDGVAYAAVTLERSGALALVDVTDPTKPTVVAVAPSGNSPFDDEPEGLAHYRDPKSGADYLYVANERSGTLGVLRVPR